MAQSFDPMSDEFDTFPPRSSDGGQELPADGLEETAALRAEIAERLAAFSTNQRGYQTRLCRVQGQRLQIHARHNLSRQSRSCYYTPDQLAHRLTMELAPDEARAFLAPGQLDGFLERVDRFLLIPERAVSDHHLLTHIFCPERRLLAFYLYPRRFDEVERDNRRLAVRRAAQQTNPRLDVASAHRATGLLGAVIAAISEDPLAAENTTADLQQFMIPVALLAPEELQELERTHELYSEALPEELP